MASTDPSRSPRTAVLMMDFQNSIVEMIPEPGRAAVVAKAASVLARARQRGLPVFHVIVRFRPGHPEVNPLNKGFMAAKQSDRLVEGTPAAEIHPAMAPTAGEPVVTKRRVSGLWSTELDMLLRAAGAERLVMCGLVTGGVITSTLRAAADMDYAIVAVKDACADPDEEVHRVLMDKLFPRQADVVTTDQALALLDGAAGGR